MREERRRFQRVPISVQVRAKHTDERGINAKSFDISVGGIGILSPEELPKGELIELEMNLPAPLVIACGEVAWTKNAETKDGKFFQTGIRLPAGFMSAGSKETKASAIDAAQTYHQKGDRGSHKEPAEIYRFLWLYRPL